MNELKPQTDALPTGIPVPNRLGFINYAPSANYSNCKLVAFESPVDANGYFEEHRDQLLVSLLPGPDGTVCALVAKSLSDEELEELNEIASILEEERAKRRSAREEQEAVAREANEKAQREERELLTVGRKCREHHAPLVEEVRKLKDEVKKLRKGK